MTKSKFDIEAFMKHRRSKPQNTQAGYPCAGCRDLFDFEELKFVESRNGLGAVICKKCEDLEDEQ